MEDTRNAPEILYAYEDRSGHRIYRRSKNNNSPCSRCGAGWVLIGELPQLAGESREAWEVRALTFKPERVR